MSQPVWERVRALLKALEDTRDVPGFLTAANCVGRPNSDRHCPIVRYLETAEPSLKGRVHVDPDTVRIAAGPGSVEVELRGDFPNIRQFVFLFDTNHYPDLIENEDDNSVIVIRIAE